MRITTIDELTAYLRAEVVRIQAERALLQENAGPDDPSSLRDAHLDGELAAVQKTLVMVSDDAFADDERERAKSGYRPVAAGSDVVAAGPADTPAVVASAVAVEPEWPNDPSDRATVR